MTQKGFMRPEMSFASIFERFLQHWLGLRMRLYPVVLPLSYSCCCWLANNHSQLKNPRLCVGEFYHSKQNLPLPNQTSPKSLSVISLFLLLAPQSFISTCSLLWDIRLQGNLNLGTLKIDNGILQSSSGLHSNVYPYLATKLDLWVLWHRPSHLTEAPHGCPHVWRPNPQKLNGAGANFHGQLGIRAPKSYNLWRSLVAWYETIYDRILWLIQFCCWCYF